MSEGMPTRSGPRPRTGPAIPHQQLDQTAPRKWRDELWRRMTQLEGVSVGPSRVSPPSTRAVHLDAALAAGPVQAFMVGTEFAHLHGPSDGSLHVALPEYLAAEAIAAGWADPHPLARAGQLPPTIVMLYEPELQIVWQLVRASYAFARGAAFGHEADRDGGTLA